jgi:uncharacterized membrane-anchored protein YhcB (DUF1043 family)
MTWLFGQTWFLIAVAFIVGSVVAWLVAKIALPHINDLESETGMRTEGVI